MIWFDRIDLSFFLGPDTLGPNAQLLHKSGYYFYAEPLFLQLHCLFVLTQIPDTVKKLTQIESCLMKRDSS